MSQQVLPAKPATLSDGEWGFVLARDCHQCANVEKCRANGQISQTGFCSENLDCDHEHPRSLNGDDSWVNLRLYCSGPNRGRPVEPAKRWAIQNFWDYQIVIGKLREIQRIAGFDAITDRLLGPVLMEYRHLLLKRITLLPGVTGVGKTVLTQSVMFAINQVVGVGRPRVNKILWFEPDQTLRDSVADELRKDAVSLGIITHRAPDVTVAESYSDLIQDPGEHDICVSCPQALFEVKIGEGYRRSDDEIRKALQWYDTIIFDEGDWADAQVRRIAILASHALKFALTASPPVIEGVEPAVINEFLKTFILISKEAIADYERTYRLDCCLKKINETDDSLGTILTSEHDKYDAFVRGLLETKDTKASLDHVVFISSILQAVHDADRLETKMRSMALGTVYSPHIIARFDRISDIEAAYKVLNQILPGQGLRNEGWRVSAIFQGHMAKLKLANDEADLSRQKAGKWVHPFMRAKNFKGVADSKCARILLMCNIGVRGINNWPLLFAVDCTISPSDTECIQFRMGRPIRLPTHLSGFLADDSLREFVTMRLYLPAVGNVDEKLQQIKRIGKFILEMQEQIVGSGFQTWYDLIENGELEAIPVPNNDPRATPFNQIDRYKIQTLMGDAIMAGVDLENDDEIERIVSELRPEPTDNRRVQARNYAIRLRDDARYRDNEILARNTAHEALIHPEVVITQLKEQDNFPVEVLKRFVQTDIRFEQMRQAYLDHLNAGDNVVIDAVSRILREQQRFYYSTPPKMFRLQGRDEDGVLPAIAGQLSRLLLDAGSLRKENIGEVNRALNIVAKDFFGVRDAKEGGPMDHHAYHVAILGRCRKRLQELTYAKLVRDGVLPVVAKLAGL